MIKLGDGNGLGGGFPLAWCLFAMRASTWAEQLCNTKTLQFYKTSGKNVAMTGENLCDERKLRDGRKLRDESCRTTNLLKFRSTHMWFARLDLVRMLTAGGGDYGAAVEQILNLAVKSTCSPE